MMAMTRRRMVAGTAAVDPHEPWDPPAHYVRRYLPEWDGRVVRPV